MNADYLVLTLDDIYTEAVKLAKQIKKDFNPDIIIAISRGGLVLARFLCDLLRVKDLQVLGVGLYTSINQTEKNPRLLQDISKDIANLKVLLVDDVSDTGKSLLFASEYLQKKKCKELKSTTIHFKPKSLFKPNYYTEKTSKWIVYPWEYVEFCSQYIQQEKNKGIEKEQIKSTLIKFKIPLAIITQLINI